MFWDLKDATQNTWAGLSNNKNSGEKIITHSLDTIFEHNIEIILLKVDVEGAESFVFEGAKRLLIVAALKILHLKKMLKEKKTSISLQIDLFQSLKTTVTQ